jgi:hypothetical protein
LLRTETGNKRQAQQREMQALIASDRSPYTEVRKL